MRRPGVIAPLRDPVHARKLLPRFIGGANISKRASGVRHGGFIFVLGEHGTGGVERTIDGSGSNRDYVCKAAQEMCDTIRLEADVIGGKVIMESDRWPDNMGAYQNNFDLPPVMFASDRNNLCLVATS